MTIEIRSARLDDMEALLALYRELHPEDDPPPPEKERRRLFREALATVEILVAEEDGRLTATAMLAVVPNLTRGMKPFGVVENVVTAADHRRKGLGRLIMSSLIERAKDRGCYKIMVLSKQTPEALSLYRSLGFEQGLKTGMTLALPRGVVSTDQAPA